VEQVWNKFGTMITVTYSRTFTAAAVAAAADTVIYGRCHSNVACHKNHDLCR